MCTIVCSMCICMYMEGNCVYDPGVAETLATRDKEGHFWAHETNITRTTTVNNTKKQQTQDHVTTWLE